MCEQWNAGLKYVRYHILSDFNSDIIEEEHVAVYTRTFDEPRIQRMIDTLDKKIKNINKNVAQRNPAAIKLKMLEGVKEKEQLTILKDFLAKQFTYSDRYIKEEKHVFEIGELLYDDTTQNYQYILNVTF